MKNHLLHVKTFCALYACGITKTYELIASGELEAVKIGGATRITSRSAEAWASRLPKKSRRHLSPKANNPGVGDDR